MTCFKVRSSTPGVMIDSRSLLTSFLTLSVVAACGGGGGGSRAAAPPVGATPPPITVSLTSNASTVAAGESVTLQWSSRNADSCSATGGWNGARATSGSETVGPIQNDQTFSLSCSGAGGGGTADQVLVRVESTTPVNVVLQVERQRVRINDSVRLSWNATGADTCVASGGWSGTQSASGSYTSVPLTSTTSFSIRCESGGQSALSSVTVDVTDLRLAWQAPQANVDGTPLTDLTAYNVHWGNTSGIYPNERRLPAGVTEWDYSELVEGEYYVALTAENSLGEESEYSTEVRLLVPE